MLLGREKKSGVRAHECKFLMFSLRSAISPCMYAKRKFFSENMEVTYANVNILQHAEQKCA